MAHDEKAAAFKAMDLEAQSYPNEKLPSSTIGLVFAASIPLPPHPILSVRGIWTLLRPSYCWWHRFLDSVAILLWWHYFGPTVNFVWIVFAHLFAGAEWELNLDMLPGPFSGGYPELFAVAFMLYRVAVSLSGLCGCSDDARRYGSRWLWTSFYDDREGPVSFRTALNQSAREMLWTMARAHELAWSVVFTSMQWSVFVVAWNAWTISLRSERSGPQLFAIAESRRYMLSDAVVIWVCVYVGLIVWVNVFKYYMSLLRQLCYLEAKPTFSVAHKVLTRLNADASLMLM